MELLDLDISTSASKNYNRQSALNFPAHKVEKAELDKKAKNYYVGGIGSVPGAFLGGLLIALLETLWSAYASIAYRDVAVFAVLIGFLVLRPQGLLGLPDFRKQQ